MRYRRPHTVMTLLAVLTLAALSPAAAQDWLRDAAKRAVKGEAARQVGRAVRGAIRCAVGEIQCYEDAKKDGKEVVFVDENGEVIEDAAGNPVTDPADLPPQPRQVSTGSTAAAPQSVNPNFDFERGERVLFHDDWSGDNLGDFPRRLELVQGSWDVVEGPGGRYLRAVSNGSVRIPLPEVLPDRFTIELPVSLDHGNAYLRITTGPAYSAPRRDYRGTVVSTELNRAGLRAIGEGPEAMAARLQHVFRTDGPAPLRVMADGSYMKVYLGQERVAQAPNAVFPRSDALYLAVSSASADHPILIGAIRVAAGGRDLYEAIAAEGRVAVHDILFDTDAATIRPESAEVLAEIATMLQQHPELSLMVEGHTDSTGDFDHNMELSKRRADSVKHWLVENHGIAAERLRTMGLGSTQPKDTNDTDAGRQQNRRVELVRIGP